jgi:hypothetical protein
MPAAVAGFEPSTLGWQGECSTIVPLLLPLYYNTFRFKMILMSLVNAFSAFLDIFLHDLTENVSNYLIREA